MAGGKVYVLKNMIMWAMRHEIGADKITDEFQKEKRYEMLLPVAWETCS
jgi:hypothetical protein